MRALIAVPSATRGPAPGSRQGRAFGTLNVSGVWGLRPQRGSGGRRPLAAGGNTSLLKQIGISLLLMPALARAAAPAPVAARGGIVVAAQHLASEVGADILRHGGNAYDAAVAVGYALAVTYPQAGNLGGGGFLTWRRANGEVGFLDFREKAPAAATATMFQDANGKLRPGESIVSWKASGVPGTPAGLEWIRTHLGTMPRAPLMAPAIALARDGYAIGQGDVGLYALLAPRLARDPATAAIFLPGGRAPSMGDRLVQADLGRTLQQIADQGPDRAFYHGPVGAAIVAASQAGGGILAAADFAKYRVRALAPVQCDYRGYTIISAPPPSSGGTTLCEILAVLSGYDLHAMGFHSAAEVHVLAEAMRHAFVDRNNKLGDPDFWKNPVADLIGPAHAAAVRQAIDPLRAPPVAAAPATDSEGSETTHYSIVDAAGNAAAVTYTLNGWFGSGHVAAGTGIVMNNEMDDFTTKIGAANMFGLVQGAANAIAPNKTPLSSMTPTIVTKDGTLSMVLGSPGGSRIITIVAEALVNAIDHGMTMQEAIDAPRLHEQGTPAAVLLERGALSADTRALLAGRGYTFRDTGYWGCAEGIIAGGPALAPVDFGFEGLLVPGARLWGAHDARDAAGSAVAQ